MTYWFDGDRIRELVRRGLEDALDEVADEVAAEAKRRAPIRKVFKEPKGFRRKFRDPTGAELSQATARASAYYGVNPGYLVGRKSPRSPVEFYEARVQVPRRGSNNAISVSRKARVLGTIKKGRFKSESGAFRLRGGGYEPGPEMKRAMTAQGRYEVRSGRAIHLSPSSEGHSVRVQVGGALKASIENEGVRETPTGSEAVVTAGIRYAKYVEFPTRRTAAQPFLLPALQDQRAKLPKAVADAIRKNLGG
jgi:hypothetical protein